MSGPVVLLTLGFKKCEECVLNIFQGLQVPFFSRKVFCISSAYFAFLMVIVPSGLVSDGTMPSYLILRDVH